MLSFERGLFLVSLCDNHTDDDCGDDDEKDKYFEIVSRNLVMNGILRYVRPIPKQIHFFFLADLALVTAPSSWVLPCCTCVTVFSALSSMC